MENKIIYISNEQLLKTAPYKSKSKSTIFLYTWKHGSSSPLSGLQRRRLIPALTLDSSSSPSQRSSKQAVTSSSSSSSSPGACWVDGPLGPPTPSNHWGVAASTETIEIKVYEIDDVERLQKRRDKGQSKVSFWFSWEEELIHLNIVK